MYNVYLYLRSINYANTFYRFCYEHFCGIFFFIFFFLRRDVIICRYLAEEFTAPCGYARKTFPITLSRCVYLRLVVVVVIIHYSTVKKNKKWRREVWPYNGRAFNISEKFSRYVCMIKQLYIYYVRSVLCRVFKPPFLLTTTM